MSPYDGAERKRKYQRARYRRLKKEGVCPRCATNKPGPRGVVYCESCLDEMATGCNRDPVKRRAYIKRRYYDLKAKGICPRCGIRRSGPRSTVYCEICVDDLRNITRAKNKKRAENKECRQCGAKLEPWMDGKYCQLCYDKRQDRNYIANLERRA